MQSPQHASARTLNPEAGEHPISAHPGEQAAAQAATRLSWKEFPYYAKRYGERGWRFSLSDSGWLQTLSELSLEAAKSQVLWLANLLAARGMPRFLLERHLQHLHAQLLISVPAQAEGYGFLLALSGYLREIRVAHIPEERFTALANAFESATENCADKVRNMGVVIVAAVADDAAGAGGVLESVKSWATEGFSAEWVSAVQATIERARTPA